MTDDDQLRHAGIGRALARIPSGLFILTAGRGATATGMLASWVTQCGFEPPAITVALRKGRPIEDLVRREGVFCLSILDADCRSLMAHFARGFDPGEPAFTGLAMVESHDGVPYPVAAHAHLECRLLGCADWSDHVVCGAEVIAGDGRLEAAPLVHVRKNGFSY
jgi:flavin reductase (DIM6/NTAB) family NADH-FMN oxidoreductase RutF